MSSRTQYALTNISGSLCTEPHLRATTVENPISLLFDKSRHRRPSLAVVLVARQRAADRTCRIKVPSSPAPLRSEPQAAKGMRQARAAGSGGRPSPATCTRPGISVGSARHRRTPGQAVTVPGRMLRVAALLHAAAQPSQLWERRRSQSAGGTRSSVSGANSWPRKTRSTSHPSPPP